MTAHPDLVRAERAMLAHARADRLTVAAGSLTACLTAGEREPLLQVALASGHDPDGWDASVAALLALRATHGTVPRLEYLEELHPALLPALQRAGFRLSSRAAVMVATAAGVEPRPWPATARYLDLADASDGDLVGYLAEQARAYAMPARTGRAFLPLLRRGLATGTSLAAAAIVDGAMVSGASLLVAPESAELAGVWTAPERRGLGLAGSLCARLLAEAAGRGVDHVWLSAAEDVAGLYHGLGFRRVGIQVNVDPPEDGVG